MKTFYKMIIFLVMFQMSAVLIAGINVFPDGTTLYSDLELSEITDNIDNPQNILSYMFLPEGRVGKYALDEFTLSALIIFIVITGAAISIATQNSSVVIVAVLGISFVPMVTKSLTFFHKLFVLWDGAAIIYTTIGVGVFLMFVFMILETPSHGRS